MHTSVPGPVAEFTTTHWSVVLAAGATGSAEASDALERLCRAYWLPLYAYVRRSGHSPEDAQDLTQEFFARLLEKNYVALANRERGRFRTFLLSSLRNFLTNEYRHQTRLKRGGGRQPVWLDGAEAEQRLAAELIETRTPDTLYDRRWALTLLETALRRLRAEYGAEGRGPLYDLLKPYVWGDKNAATYAEVAAQLDLTEEAVKKAVQRLRHSFRERLRDEIGQTVTTVSEVEEELRHVIEVLRG